ncbi:putative Protein of unknown function (DUF705) NLI interacting factor like phosphatase [Trypanosoma vivax]|uniref:Mitochondrial import inner membrane translocase subunit TIM50 n=1 Tax=Trypanosoma vivax (strain Y486) TaxID=1055687 RepID=G0TTV7_TRYVY|nr:hypothetical protein TRVL_02611 [Trypanosoma vivax]KAH8613776.1 putative Protein of unknown function (DUF705) NLI interacting factor like phosphatase [Trypanosoma vivax]CCC47390.1 conserved hypothetical protein [Trypanosoma vivax Y486]
MPPFNAARRRAKRGRSAPQPRVGTVRGYGVHSVLTQVKRSLVELQPPAPVSEVAQLSSSLCLSSEVTPPSSDDEASVYSVFKGVNEPVKDFVLASRVCAVNGGNMKCCGTEIFHVVRPFLHCSRRSSNDRFSATHNAPFALLPQRSQGSSRHVALTLAGTMLSDTEGAARAMSPYEDALLPHNTDLANAPLCVVVDLDETLVAARCGSVYARPYVKEFLDACHEGGCEVVVWSAGSSSHVDGIVKALAVTSERRKWYHHIISRHHRWCGEGADPIKDLSKLGRPLNRIMLLENNPKSVQRQPQYSVLLEDYMQPSSGDYSLRLIADVVRRIVARMRIVRDTRAVDVARILSVDPELVPLVFPISCSSTAYDTTMDVNILHSRGLRYSPGAISDIRRYGGERPLSIIET